MTRLILMIVCMCAVSACVETSIQPLSQSSFKVATEADEFCGRKGARETAFKTAAIEVIRRGEDRFVVVGDQSNTAVTGGQFTTYGGFQTFNTSTQDMVIQIVRKDDPRYADSLSARQTLGADWAAIVAKGSPNTCS